METKSRRYAVNWHNLAVWQFYMEFDTDEYMCVCVCLIQMFEFSILLDAIDDESNFMFMFEIVKIQCLVTVFTLAL